MATDKKFADYVCEQAGLSNRVSTKRMFGEYALYLDAKVVAFLCDNQVFVKPTDAGRELLGTVTEAPAYPGSKLYFQVNEHLDDQARFRTLLITTADTLPAAKAKKPKKPKEPKEPKKPKEPKEPKKPKKPKEPSKATVAKGTKTQRSPGQHSSSIAK